METAHLKNGRDLHIWMQNWKYQKAMYPYFCQKRLPLDFRGSLPIFWPIGQDPPTESKPSWCWEKFIKLFKFLKIAQQTLGLIRIKFQRLYNGWMSTFPRLFCIHTLSGGGAKLQLLPIRMDPTTKVYQEVGKMTQEISFQHLLGPKSGPWEGNKTKKKIFERVQVHPSLQMIYSSPFSYIIIILYKHTL